jgi:hypothetical protein
MVTGFFIIFNSQSGKNEPQNLRYAITLSCPNGAEGRQYVGCRRGLKGMTADQSLPHSRPSSLTLPAATVRTLMSFALAPEIPLVATAGTS